MSDTVHSSSEIPRIDCNASLEVCSCGEVRSGAVLTYSGDVAHSQLCISATDSLVSIMAQALAERIYPWNGGDAAVWPPRSALTGSTSYEVERTVLSHHALNVRKANEQQGYMKQSVTSDVNFKHRALELKVASAKDLTTGKSVPLADLPKLFEEFGRLASGAAPTAAAGASIVFWADAQLQSELSAKFDRKPVELTNAFVRLQTEGSTWIAKTVDLVTQASQNKLAPKLSDQPNLFANAQSKFNPAAAAAVGAKPKKKDDADDWDD